MSWFWMWVKRTQDQNDISNLYARRWWFSSSQKEENETIRRIPWDFVHFKRRQWTKDQPYSSLTQPRSKSCEKHTMGWILFAACSPNHEDLCTFIVVSSFSKRANGCVTAVSSVRVFRISSIQHEFRGHTTCFPGLRCPGIKKPNF